MIKINVKILISNDFHNPQCINFLIIPSKNKIRKKKVKIGNIFHQTTDRNGWNNFKNL